ncbi:MAG: hypothetical protein IT437_05080, partial [Phycisphaerales bacterium]|nr:hypothetical protein [Phycisphaerales bacterium]
MKSRVQLMGLAAAMGAGFASSAVAQSTAYVIDNRAPVKQMASFPINAPAFNIIGPVTATCFAIEFDSTGTLYGITYSAGALTNQLGKFDTGTGAFTPIATLSGPGLNEANAGGMAWDQTTSTMYMLGGQNLFKIDLATAATTLVAPITGGPAGALWIEIACGPTGDMYIHDIATDQMCKIDKNTGVCTILGPTGLLANFAQGMDFDPDTNILYACMYTGGGTGQFCTVNLTTGACTPVVNTQPWTPNGPEMEIAILGTGAVPCYPDCNGDGVLNLSDFGCFTTKFALGDPYADCNGDGIRNLSD